MKAMGHQPASVMPCGFWGVLSFLVTLPSQGSSTKHLTHEAESGAVQRRRQPQNPVLVPQPRYPLSRGVLPDCTIPFSLLKPTAIFPGAWGWHHLLIFVVRMLRAVPCGEQECVDEACFGGKQRDATFTSELFTHFQLQVKVDQEEGTNANCRDNAAGT